MTSILFLIPQNRRRSFVDILSINLIILIFSILIRYNLFIRIDSEKSVQIWTEYSTVACPCWSSGNVAKILYGLPDFNDDLQDKLKSGRIALGGCEINRDFPV